MFNDLQSPKQQQENINYILSEGIKEILKKGLKVKEKSLGSLEDDINSMLRAFQLKNRIWDYAVFINYNELLKRFEGKIAYSLVNTEHMKEEDKSLYETSVEFNF